MDLYYYQVGKKGAVNFPVSLGDKDGSLVNFTIDNIEEFLPDDFPTKILQSINFQIWGIPNTSGFSLKKVNSMSRGDWIMILGSEDKVNYIGEFLGTFSDNKGLSKYIWKDDIFSQIMFFQGNMVDLPWKVPHDLLGYDNYRPDRKLTRVAKNRNPGTMEVISEISKFIIEVSDDMKPLGEIFEKEPPGPEGYVYAITNPSFPGWVKVGKAQDEKTRLKNYQTGDPHRSYEMWAKEWFEDRSAAEKRAHKQLKEIASNWKGEWFKLNVSDVESVLKNL